MKLRPRSALQIVAVVIILMLGWWSMRIDGHSQPLEVGGSAPDMEHRPAPASSSPTATSSAEDRATEAQCGGDLAQVSELASQVAASCREDFALGGLCPEPVPFPPGKTPEGQAREIEEEFRECGLSPGELRIDCSEYPCLTILSRSALGRGDDGCEALRRLAEQAPSVGDQVAAAPPEWAAWVPFLGEEAPSDPDLYVRVAARAPSRFAAVGRRLASLPEGTAGELPTDCSGVRRALADLRSPGACDALRAYWDCPASEEGRVSRERYAQYVAFAEGVLDDLVETCPPIDRDNTFLDCSGVPCFIVVHTGDLQLGNDEVFCEHPDLSSFTGSGLVPNVKIAEVWLEKRWSLESGVRERYEEERRLRIRQAIEQAQRMEVGESAP